MIVGLHIMCVLESEREGRREGEGEKEREKGSPFSVASRSLGSQ